MKTMSFSILLCLLMASQALAEVRIFTCEPEWASLATELAGDNATIHSATTGLQDPHHITARPSLIAKMRRADMLICNGADLEVGWLPLLLRKAGNAKVQPGNAGYIEAANFVLLKEKPVSLDRSQGDVHPQGNPHLHTDPRNIAVIAQVVQDRLIQIDPANTAYYRQRYESFALRWQQAISRWEAETALLKGVPVVTQHKSWTYMLDWLGMKRIAVVENKPGIPAGAGHIARVAKSIQQQSVKMIIRAAYQNPRISAGLSQRTGVPVVVLPYTVGGTTTASDLFSLFDETLQLLKQHAGR